MVLDITKPRDYIDIAVYLTKELEQSAVERDNKGGAPSEEINKLCESGLLTLVIPKHG